MHVGTVGTVRYPRLGVSVSGFSRTGGRGGRGDPESWLVTGEGLHPVPHKAHEASLGSCSFPGPCLPAVVPEQVETFWVGVGSDTRGLWE